MNRVIEIEPEWPGKCRYCPMPSGFGRIVCRDCAMKKIQQKYEQSIKDKKKNTADRGNGGNTDGK